VQPLALGNHSDQPDRYDHLSVTENTRIIPLFLKGIVSGGPDRGHFCLKNEWSCKYQGKVLQIRGRPFTNCEWRLRRITMFRRDLSTRWVGGRGSPCATVGVHRYIPKCMLRSPPGPWGFSVSVSKPKKINSGPSVWLEPSVPM
jgi:hypothetical protein